MCSARVMVTGGAGFIGSAVIRQLIRDTDFSVLNVDKMTYAANPNNLNEVLPSQRYSFAKCDISDSSAVKKLFSEFQPDYVMHLAAETHVDRSIDGPADFITTNIVGTYTLLEAARCYWDEQDPKKQEQFRFHHVSTDEVFGSLGPEGLFTEETAYAPNSPYSASKASSDMLVRAWHETFGLPVVTSNCSNNYGPYQFPEKLIPVVILAALEGRPIPIYGTGENVRDWLYVDDHATALRLVMEKGTAGEIYAIGGWNEMTNNDLVRLICKALDEHMPDSPYTPHEQLISFVEDRPGHDQRYAIDATKISEKLGWRPQVTVDVGIRQTVQWYLENRWWWEGIRTGGFDGERLGLSLSTNEQAS